MIFILDMNINIIQNTNYYSEYSTISFKKWKRDVYNISACGVKEALKHRNDTEFFREPPNWKETMAFLSRKFKNVDKVQVYDYACSNGSEACTFIMAALEHEPEFAKKFSFVKAMDYDESAIEEAKISRYAITSLEISRINDNTANGFNKYFKKVQLEKPLTIDKKYEYFSNDFYEPREILTDKIGYMQADITKDYKNIEPDNSIVLARNFWPYLGIQKQSELAQNLYKQLGNNSYLIIGDFDSFYKTDYKLFDAGFCLTLEDFIFSKNNLT